jgi:hypothetical protein
MKISPAIRLPDATASRSLLQHRRFGQTGQPRRDDYDTGVPRLHTPIVVAYGTFETPDFQRQSRDFAAAVKAAGKPVQLIEAPNYAHLEMVESLGNPYGPGGRAALAMMELSAIR